MIVDFLGSIPGAYFNAVLICFFSNLLRHHGLASNLINAIKLSWPVLEAILAGYVPAVLISAIIQYFVPSLASVQYLLIPLGVLISATLLRRTFLTENSKTKKWNIVIIILTLLQVMYLGISIFILNGNI